MSEDRIDKIIQRWRRLSGEKSQWHYHWDDLARVMLPRRMGFATTVIEGGRRVDDIFDSTPMQAARGLANAIGGMIRPQGIPEIEMKAEDEGLNSMGEVKDWFADSEERVKGAFNNPKARFRNASGEVDQDLVVFGTAAMFIGEGIKRNHLMFQSLHLKDATPFFSEEGNPEGMFHHRKMTARQLAERFGANKLSEKSTQLLKDSPDTKVEILHAVIPRQEARERPLFARDLLIADLWIEIDGKHLLSEGGFHEFPFIVPRWDTSSGEDYGRSPGMIALPDADTLQSMGETILIAGQRAADPPLAAPNDGSFDAVNTFPGGLSYYDVETAVSVRGNPFFPIESGMNLPISRDMQMDTRSQIFSAFFRNVLNLPIAGPQMTATEIIQRKEEFIREIGPVFGKLESDYTAPMVERAFMIMLRAGAFPPIPKALQGQNVRFEYDSPVKQIRQQIEATAAKQWAAEVIQLSQFKPEAADLINIDELGRFTAEATGIPKKIVNSEDAVQELRMQRQQMLEVQQQQEAIATGVAILKTGAEAADKAGLTQKGTTQQSRQNQMRQQREVA